MPPDLALLLSIFALLLALLLALAWVIAGQIIRRRPPDPPATPADYDVAYEHVTFAARDGVRLGGWLAAEPGSRRPTVIFCPGITGSMDGDTHFVPWFTSAGFDVLQFDWRAHGVSEGDRVSFGVREIDDVLGAVGLLQARGVTRIGLMGFSMGGAVALRAAAREARIACVVCDGGFVRADHAISAALQARIGGLGALIAPIALWLAGVRLGGISLRAADPLPDVARISPRPVLFIHGSEDRYVPVPDQEAIFAAAGEPKSLWRVEGAGHREAHRLEPEEYRRRVIAFFKAHLHS